MAEKQDATHGYKLHNSTPTYLGLVREHTEPYFFELNGESILILPGVMSPKYDWAGHYMIENLPDVQGKDVLEIGSGCGLVSMAAFRNDAKSVLATDINKKAVENTALNFERINASSTCHAIYSDVFDRVEGQFDVVIFNAPYHGCEAADDLEKGVADEGYYALRRFFAGLRNHLKDGGVAAIGFSSSGDHQLFDQLCHDSGLDVVNSVEDVRHGYQCEVHILKNEISDRNAFR